MSANPLSSQWIAELEKGAAGGMHVALVGDRSDKHLFRGAFGSSTDCATQALASIGYEVVGAYDVGRGLRFVADDMRTLFAAARAPGPTRASPDGPAGAGASPDAGPQPAIVVPAPGTAYLQDPTDFVLALSAVLAQQRTACAVVVSHADSFFTALCEMGPVGQRVITLLVSSLEHAGYASDGPGKGLRNAVAFEVASLADLHPTLANGRGRGLLHFVQVALPAQAEREYFVRRYFPNYEGAGDLDPGEAEQAVSDLARATDGMSIREMDAVRRVGRRQGVPISDPRGLVRAYTEVGSEDPWSRLDARQLAEVDAELRHRVRGQPEAIASAMGAVTTATLRLSVEPGTGVRGPRAAFLCVGPTGVGKTELVRGLARGVYGDDDAFARFDMAEYSHDHEVARLFGAPPGYIGYEEGGQLTNRLHERPASIVLLDEIEKAHPSVFDKLLAILDAGRLTDGHGRTASFDRALLFLTSNIGSATCMPAALDWTYERIRDHFVSSAEAFFRDELGRPELFGRIDSDRVIVFRPLTPDMVADIADKFLSGLAASALEEAGIEVEWDSSVPAAIEFLMRAPSNAAYGGRRVRNLVTSLVRDPLVQWILAHAPQRGTRLTLELGGEPPVLTVSA